MYDSLEKLYVSLKTDSRPLPLGPPPIPTQEATSRPPSLTMAAGDAGSSGNPFAASPLAPAESAGVGEKVSSQLEVEPDVRQQLTGLKSELHALLRVLD